MFVSYLTLPGTSADFPQPSHFCSLYVTSFSPLDEPQNGANHMILPHTLLHIQFRLPRATYPISLRSRDTTRSACVTACTKVHVPSKRRATLTQRHSVTAQKTR